MWHLKVSLRKNWGRMKEVIARIERARAEGVDIAADIYPYVAASNGLVGDRVRSGRRREEPRR